MRTMDEWRRIFGAGADAGPAEVIAAAKRVIAERRAVERAGGDLVTVQLLEDEFSKMDVDPIELPGCFVVDGHALSRLAARGITQPTADEYAAERVQTWWQERAGSEPLPVSAHLSTEGGSR